MIAFFQQALLVCHLYAQFPDPGSIQLNKPGDIRIKDNGKNKQKDRETCKIHAFFKLSQHQQERDKDQCKRFEKDAGSH